MLRLRYRLACSTIACLGILISSALETRDEGLTTSYANCDGTCVSRKAGYDVKLGVLMDWSELLLYKCPTVAIPEPDGKADPPCVESGAIVAVGKPAFSGRRLLRRYRSGDGLTALACDAGMEREGVFNSMEESGLCALCFLVEFVMDASSFEPDCGVEATMFDDPSDVFIRRSF